MGGSICLTRSPAVRPTSRENPMHDHPVIIVPGLHDSGPAHWQSLWEAQNPAFARVRQRDWETPRRSEWIDALENTVARYDKKVLLVAHSLGVATVVHWARHRRDRALGAMLVSPSDVDCPAHSPEVVRDFSPLPTARLPFPSVLVASRNDPWVSFERAQHFARAWGSRLVDIGERGHINADSGLGSWEQGFQLFEDFVSELTAGDNA